MTPPSVVRNACLHRYMNAWIHAYMAITYMDAWQITDTHHTCINILHHHAYITAYISITRV